MQERQQRILDDAAKATEARAAADARAQAEEAAREAAMQTHVEALQANAPAYEAGFGVAATAFKEALKRGDQDLDKFVKGKVNAFEVEVTKKGLKGGEIDAASSRSGLLYEFVKTIENPTFTYSLNGTTVTVQFYGAFVEVWQDYLWKAIARSSDLGADFKTDDAPEGESDGFPGEAARVTVTGKNIYEFKISSDQGNHGGTDFLSIAFGAGSEDPQEMESSGNDWNQASSGSSVSEAQPASYSDEYHCAYNPSKDSVMRRDGDEATVPDRLNGIWPVGNAFRR